MSKAELMTVLHQAGKGIREHLKLFGLIRQLLLTVPFRIQYQRPGWIFLKDLHIRGYCCGMTGKPNPRQLVLRRDTATGMTLVGWDADLPAGRFEHLELICESATSILPDSQSEYYDAYQSALYQARQANALILEQQVRDNQSKGWYLVPFELAPAPDQETMMADRFGNYAAAAMRLNYQITQNRKQAWAVVQRDTVVHARARYPQRELDELTMQVWYHRQLKELKEMGGTLLEGKLVICESGLWFISK